MKNRCLYRLTSVIFAATVLWANTLLVLPANGKSGVAALQEKLDKTASRYNLAKTDREKWRYGLSFLGVLVKMGGVNNISSKHKSTFGEISKLFLSNRDEIVSFEAALSGDQRRQIAQGADESWVVELATFTLPSAPATCKSKDYKEIKKTFELSKLLKQVFPLAMLVGLYKDQLRPLYYKRLLKQMAQENCQTDRCLKVAGFYTLFQLGLNPPLRKKIDDKIKSIENDLVSEGLSKKEITARAAKNAKKWPNCLGRFSPEFYGYLRSDITIYRAQFFCKQIEETASSEAGNIELKRWVQKDDPLLSDAHDAWRTPYQIKSKKNYLILVSAGPDLLFETSDDIPACRVSLSEAT